MALTDRWYRLRPHPQQSQLWRTKTRFVVVAAGRRSGKTEVAKRKLVRACLEARRPDARFFAAAPTRDQARALYWEDLIDLCPRDMIHDPHETRLEIRFKHGPRLVVAGLDKPQRIEGTPWDGGVIDEIADVKPKAWSANIRPALSDRQGWAWFVGVPEGRGLFWDLYSRGVQRRRGWESYTWKSSTVLPAEEIAAAKEDLEPDLFAQEYEAAFVLPGGRAYRQFSEDRNVLLGAALGYRRDRPLIFCLDFNVEPGAAVVAQEQENGEVHLIGEVHVPFGSDTPTVCARLVHDWGGHAAPVLVYGDATGGARKTSAVEGTDWDLVRSHLGPYFPDLRILVDKSNPAERARVNAVNSLLLNAAGRSRLMIDPLECPQTFLDLVGVMRVEGGSGELDKKRDKSRTHWTDALGYYVAKRWPVEAGPTRRRTVRAPYS